jgi:hypothetical protein
MNHLMENGRIEIGNRFHIFARHANVKKTLSFFNLSGRVPQRGDFDDDIAGQKLTVWSKGK